MPFLCPPDISVLSVDFGRESEACFVCMAGEIGDRGEDTENMEWLLKQPGNRVVGQTFSHTNVRAHGHAHGRARTRTDLHTHARAHRLVTMLKHTHACTRIHGAKKLCSHALLGGGCRRIPPPQSADRGAP